MKLDFFNVIYYIELMYYITLIFAKLAPKGV